MDFVLNHTLRRIKNSHRLTQIVILISFLITFAVVRGITHLQKLNILPDQEGYLHIHHLVPGIILILITGYSGLSYWMNRKFRLLMAVFFGIGAALTIDEFALWIYLKDVYWERQGRASIDAVIISIVVLLLAFALSEAHDHHWIKKIFKKA